MLGIKETSRFSRDTAGALLDTTGVVVSWLCVLHCLVLPFALALLPLAGLSFLLSEAVDVAVLAVAIGVAALSLLPAYFRQHGRVRAIGLFAAGIGLFGISQAFEDDLLIESIFLLFGAALISSAHLVNRRLCKQCSACAEDGCS